MVTGIPMTGIKHDYESEAAYSMEPEYVAGFIVEGTKGTPNEPVLVYDEDDLYQKFKVTRRVFYGCAGKLAWVTRAAVGTVVAALDKLMDDGATPVEVLRIEALEPGSYEINIQALADNTIIVEEEGFQSERFSNMQTIQDLFEKINRESSTIKAYVQESVSGAWVDSLEEGQTCEEGSGTLATFVSKVLGEGAGNTAGSDGTTKVGATYPGELADADAPDAFETALAAMETLDNPEPSVIFCDKDLETVHAKFAAHGVDMCDSLVGRWRRVLIGAKSDANIASRSTAARTFAEEEIWYVGDSAYDQDGTLVPSNEMVQAVAGALVSTWYGDPAWGGEKKKVLGINGEPFFSELAERYSDEEAVLLNESGVITLEKGLYGIHIRETVTTATAAKYKTDSDKGEVVTIVHRALRYIKEAAEEMKGVRMTETYNTDLERLCANNLSVMETDDKTLIEADGVPAFDIEVSAIPRAKQKLGRSDIRVALNVCYAARQIFVQVTTR